MRKSDDPIIKRILKILNKAEEPLETKELEILLGNVTRIKLLYRLNLLRGDGLIKGKPVGSGKGTWIWWRNRFFNKTKNG